MCDLQGLKGSQPTRVPILVSAGTKMDGKDEDQKGKNGAKGKRKDSESTNNRPKPKKAKT